MNSIQQELKMQPQRKDIAADIPLRKTYGFETLYVTPEIATHWLTFNVVNRAITERKIVGYLREIESGRWALNGDTIRFAPGRLLDGQNRLHAIIRSGVKVLTSVCHGVDPAAQVTMDCGRNRTARDVIGIEGFGPWESGVIGAGIHGIISASKGQSPTSTVRYPNSDVRDFVLEHRVTVENTVRLLKELPRKPTILPFSRCLTLHYLFAKADPARADAFFQRLFVGDDLQRDSPIFHLRTRLLNDMATGSKMKSWTAFQMAIKTFNAFRKGAKWRSASTMYPKPGEVCEID